MFCGMYTLLVVWHWFVAPWVPLSGDWYCISWQEGPKLAPVLQHAACQGIIVSWLSGGFQLWTQCSLTSLRPETHCPLRFVLSKYNTITDEAVLPNTVLKHRDVSSWRAAQLWLKESGSVSEVWMSYYEAFPPCLCEYHVYCTIFFQSSKKTD